jgi:hypothetical protein
MLIELCKQQDAHPVAASTETGSTAPLSVSTIHAIVDCHPGDVYSCVDVLLDMLADPLTGVEAGRGRDRERAELAAVEETERPGAPEDDGGRAVDRLRELDEEEARAKEARAARAKEAGYTAEAFDELASALVTSGLLRRLDEDAEEASRPDEGTDESSVRLSLSAESAQPGDEVTVSLAFDEVRTPGDWVALVKATRPLATKSYYAQQAVPEDGSPLRFTIPKKLGICEFRYYRSSGYGILGGRSAPLRVGPAATLDVSHDRDAREIRVAWRQLDGVPSSWSWLALVPVGERDNGRATAHQYLTATVSGTAVFAAPRTAGTYVVRFVPSGAGKSHTVESAPIVVEDRDSVRAETDEAGQVFATILVPSLPPHGRNWVALATVGADAGSYIGSYEYLPVEAETKATRIRFPAPKPGTYEVRVYGRGLYTPHTASNPVTVA